MNGPDGTPLPDWNFDSAARPDDRWDPEGVQDARRELGWTDKVAARVAVNHHDDVVVVTLYPGATARDIADALMSQPPGASLQEDAELRFDPDPAGQP